MLRLRRRRPRRPELDEGATDLTPMIDIVFNLLVFFMTASKLRSAEARIEAFLPKDRGPGVVRSEPVCEVRIVLRSQPDGQVRLRLGEVLGLLPGEGPAEHDPLWGTLQARLVALRDAHTGPTPLPVILDADPQVPTRLVVLAINEVLRAHIKEITFAAPGQPIE